MGDAIETGGPAFPARPREMINGMMEIAAVNEGMTLRDWFAGRALAGMLSHATRYKPRLGASQDWHEAISEEAFQLADAMIAARTKARGQS